MKKPEIHIRISTEDAEVLEEWIQEVGAKRQGFVYNILKKALARRRHVLAARKHRAEQKKRNGIA